ncbi:hypothetical protein Leryth_026827 [Lithospermum erythrorhizon]|nr:hypothetical protein Leryth_026827 [Lithospermum erythrorhizon]
MLEKWMTKHKRSVSLGLVPIVPSLTSISCTNLDLFSSSTGWLCSEKYSEMGTSGFPVQWAALDLDLCAYVCGVNDS